MTFIFRTMTTFLLLFAAVIQAEIKQSYHISDVLEYIDAETLVLFDIDNTLIETNQCLGSDQWFNQTLEKHLKAGQEFSEALEDTLHVWWRVIRATGFQAVESSTVDVVLQAQDKAFAVVGLTSRGRELVDITASQLASVGISLPRAQLPMPNKAVGLEGEFNYVDGILFCEGQSKGLIVEGLEQQLRNLPINKVVFVDDTMRHLRRVEPVVEALGLDFVGLRYGCADEKVASYDQDIADVQLHSFEFLMTDDMARALLDHRLDEAVQHLLEYLGQRGVLGQ